MDFRLAIEDKWWVLWIWYDAEKNAEIKVRHILDNPEAVSGQIRGKGCWNNLITLLDT